MLRPYFSMLRPYLLRRPRYTGLNWNLLEECVRPG